MKEEFHKFHQTWLPLHERGAQGRYEPEGNHEPAPAHGKNSLQKSVGSVAFLYASSRPKTCAAQCVWGASLLLGTPPEGSG